MLNRKSTRLLILIISAIILYYLVTYLPLHNRVVFESPDENANYLATKLYAETGRLWYQEDYTQLDVENYLHPRHFATLGDRIVPTEFLGLPVIYAPVYALGGENTVIILAVLFALVSLLYFVKLSALLFGNRAGVYAAVIFLACLPLLYYFTRPYYNAAGAIAFFIAGSYYLVSFHRFSETRDIVLASLFMALSIFFRYDYATFAGLLVFITLVNKYRTHWAAYFKPLAVSVCVITLVSLVPILVLNAWVYGNPLTFGINILQVESIGTEAKGLWQFFLPYPIIGNMILSNIFRLVFGLLPVITLLGIIGLFYLVRSRKFNFLHMLYVLVFVYIIIQSGSSDTWKADDFSYLGLDTSIIRYWLIAYFGLMVAAVAGASFLVQKSKALAVMAIVVLLVTGTAGLLLDNERSVSVVARSLNNTQAVGESIKEHVGGNSVIFSDTFDKVLVPLGMQSAGWWGGERTYDAQKLVDSMTRVYRNSDRSVYLYDVSTYVDVSSLNSLFVSDNLSLYRTGIDNLFELKTLQ